MTPPTPAKTLLTTPRATRRRPRRRRRARRPRRKKKAKKLLDAWNKRVEQYKADRRNGGVLSAFEVTDRDGNPVSSYRIYADTGSWKDWDLKIESFLVDMQFLATKYQVSFACFLIAWSLAFKLAGLLLKPALLVSDALYTNVLVQIGLPGLCLTYAGVVAGWHLMFGRKARGWGEAAAALVISALAVTTLAAPPQMLLSEQHGAVGSARALAVEVAALILDNEEATHTPKTTINDDLDDTVPAGDSAGAQIRSKASALARPITDELVDAFIVRPSMLLSYGQTFDGECAKKFRDSRIQQAVADQWLDDVLDSPEDAVRENIPWVGDTIGDVMEGVTYGTDELVKEKVKSVGPITTFEKACVKGGNAASLKKASMDKVGGAFFMALAALLACLFITVIDWMFLHAQICIAKEAMIAKCALTIGVLPGPGRSWLWNRATVILRYLGLMVVAVASLAVLIVVIKVIINAPEKDLPGGVTVRFIVIDLVTISAFKYRKQLVRSSEGLALRARSRLGSSVFGGSAPVDLGQQTPKRSLGRKLLVGGMMLGALAASGGAYGYARGSTALTARLVRGTGRMIGGTAKLAAGTTKAAAKGSLKLGKFGLKSTLGLPVYGPRAARRTTAAVAAVPGRVTGGVEGLQQRIDRVRQQYAPPVQDFTGEYVHNLRSVGRMITGRRPLGPYTPPRRPAPTRPAGRRPAPGRRPVPTAARPVRPTPVVAPAAPPRRPVPPRVPQLPASQAQSALQMRLHRIRNRQATPPATPPASAAPATRRAPARAARPAPRRRGGGRP
ncbi:hypothetical protein [Streptomyces sp. NBC_01236]|uniref:hypothetical protein n=1 Tax=Streptomyces sp. NBC_01236 TaxID=2903789 RepID=UPI002E150BE8|nr:hypothetical protein OG324_51315 [Streptomyces sp. NBC_01236]